MQIPPESLEAHFLSISLPIILSWGGVELSRWLRDRKREKRGASELGFLLKNFQLHYHTEPDGPLHAENIRYPRNGS